jgi:hypothetical protein
MPVDSHTFWLPRRGNSPGEYEDAFALDDASGRYALADGATEGCFTGLWARLLVEDFISHAEWDASQWPFSLAGVEEQWDTEVRARKLDWDADYWLEQGAFAAFLGLVLTDSPFLSEGGPGVRASCHWEALAVGDTCLFHTRDGALARAFPLECSDQFSNRPQLVGSRMAVGEVCKRQRLWSDGYGHSGDRLWAMTDALAKWCLTQHEAGGNPWRDLESLLSSGASLPSPASWRGAGGESDYFTPWIESLRDSGCLLNDDVTLLAIRL